MIFKILHIEDAEDFANLVECALEEKNKERSRRCFRIDTIKYPDELIQELDNRYDLILADVCFFDEVSEEQVDRLDEILNKVEQWNRLNKYEKPLPVIAYTTRQKTSLLRVLENSSRLYDIWDKTSASPDYVAWRITQIATDIMRIRPDSILINKILDMPNGASWHPTVKNMAFRYRNAWTEADQIERIGHEIKIIGYELKCVPDPVSHYLDVMKNWEFLGRSIQNKTRGHARHVANVYWLGYFLLNSPILKEYWGDSWSNSVLYERKATKNIASIDAIQALNIAWFYAGLFHDTANGVQKANVALKRISEILTVYKDFLKQGTAINLEVEEGIPDKILPLLTDFEEPWRTLLNDLWKSSLQKHEPDHGVVAAINLDDASKENRFYGLTKEAGRAMLVHNLISNIDNTTNKFSWKKDPIVCLLIFVDQLQTWDRERGDESYLNDWPERAELLSLELTSGNPKPILEIVIEYIPPEHLKQAPKIFERVKDKLEDILMNHPCRILRNYIEDWPFQLKVEFWMDGTKLASELQID